MIFVDQPKTSGPTRVRWCHMMTDSEDLQELHDFAKRIKMQPDWFQDDDAHPHYDLSETFRRAAIKAGAVAVPDRVLIRLCSRKVKLSKDEHDRLAQFYSQPDYLRRNLHAGRRRGHK